MKIKLSDFVELHRINVRTAQIHIKENIEELEEHIDRKGKQGTWIDEYAQEFLLKKIQLPSKDEVYIPTAREAVLMAQIMEVNKKLADAERRAGENAETAGKVFLLEEARKEQTEKIDMLTRENALLGHDIEEKNKTIFEIKESAKELSDEITAIKNKWWYKLFAGKK